MHLLDKTMYVRIIMKTIARYLSTMKTAQHLQRSLNDVIDIEWKAVEMMDDFLNMRFQEPEVFYGSSVPIDKDRIPVSHRHFIN